MTEEEKGYLQEIAERIEEAYTTISLAASNELDRLTYDNASDYLDQKVVDSALEGLGDIEAAVEEIRMGLNLLTLRFLEWESPETPPETEGRYLVKLTYKLKGEDRFGFDEVFFHPKRGWILGEGWKDGQVVGWHPLTHSWIAANC